MSADEPMTWKAPPTGGTWASVAAELRAHPGEWARLSGKRFASNRVTQIRTARLAPFRPRGAFEALSRTEDGDVVIYVRFVGVAQ